MVFKKKISYAEIYLDGIFFLSEYLTTDYQLAIIITTTTITVIKS